MLITAIILGGSGNNFGVVVGMGVLIGRGRHHRRALRFFFPPSPTPSNTLLSPVEVMIYRVLLIVVPRFRPEGLLPERPLRDVIGEPRHPLLAQLAR